ncbi:MAG: response regulator [Desulfobacterales bacterium]|nr:response regulator [Desulfobacterales bacterium]
MQKTILMIDDSVMVRRVVGQILKQSGYKVIAAEDGIMGCDLAKKFKPDLILMDIEMPNMNGVEATINIKSDPETANIPIIIFTSLGSEEDIKRAREAGGQGFMNKPICKEELKTIVTKFIG